MKIIQKISKGCKLLKSYNDFYFYSKAIFKYHNISFSQEGEDCILSRLFEGQTTGFYIDVGAHHPQRFSNTFKFYLQGWRGINIDAMPGSMKIFDIIRPEDINLEIPISRNSDTLTYYIYEDPALNTFSEHLYKERRIKASKNNIYNVIEKIQLKTFTLTEVLEKYLPKSQMIDFINIDVEGLDDEILGSLDLNVYRPKVLLIEALNNQSLERENMSNSSNLICSQGYTLFSKTVNTLIYLRKND